jgi:2,4-dienoyl-CoA reductase-like NADH-dependent reductase (Old Yellow Enzyme family)
MFVTSTSEPRRSAGAKQFPLLFSELKIRNDVLKNRIIFPPTCPSWVSSPQTARFNELAAPYYGERASGGAGLIIIGGTHVTESSIAAPLAQPGLWEDAQIEGFAKVADEVHRHGTKLAVQLRHTGVRGFPGYKMDPTHDINSTWYTLAPSQVPLGEFPGGSTPKEMSDAEIEEVLDAHGSAARRAMAAGLDGIEFHLSHGYLSWQFLSPLYNKRTDKWGGSYENRLRFCVEAMRRMREAIGDRPFIGFRINSTSLWPGDLEEAEVQQIVQDLLARTDVDFVDVSVGVHHQWIHAPMHFEGGWERPYALGIKQVSNKPVFMVGRITTPETAEELLSAGVADGIGLARQMFADPDWGLKVAEGRSEDIRKCVAANHCWKSVSKGQRVQCVYNPTMGREGQWGKGKEVLAQQPKRIVVVGAGPSGLEFARVASARGHQVLVCERSDQIGGHVFLQSLLPGREKFGEIATWLGAQAEKGGAKIRLGVDVTGDRLAEIVSEFEADHVVVATGSRVCRDGFQGWTADRLPGVESQRCYGWDEVATGAVTPTGDVVVIDDQADLVGPLIAVQLAMKGARSVRLVTRWPMVGMETIADAYFEWIIPKVYEHNVQLSVDHFVRGIGPRSVTLYNIYTPDREVEVPADAVVMVTARQSNNDLAIAAAALPVTVEVIGDAVAPRSTYEAVFEGHRQARAI